MEPKEKAKELVNTMYNVHSNSASDITLYFAKKCALIAVDEILENNEWYIDHLNDKFWQEVKNEIKKL